MIDINLMVSPICAICQRILNIIIVIVIDYDESKSLYKHVNCAMIGEHVSFDNAESLRKNAKWRIDNAAKKKFDGDSSFKSVVYGWINILASIRNLVLIASLWYLRFKNSTGKLLVSFKL